MRITDWNNDCWIDVKIGKIRTREDNYQGSPTVRCLATVAVEHWICALVGYFAKHVLYEGGISRTTLSSKHVKRKRKNERGKQLNH